MHYEVTIPALKTGEQDTTLTLEADNWVSALRHGLARTGRDPKTLKATVCDIQEDDVIVVTDAEQRRVYTLKELDHPGDFPIDIGKAPHDAPVDANTETLIFDDKPDVQAIVQQARAQQDQRAAQAAPPLASTEDPGTWPKPKAAAPAPAPKIDAKPSPAPKPSPSAPAASSAPAAAPAPKPSKPAAAKPKPAPAAAPAPQRDDAPSTLIGSAAYTREPAPPKTTRKPTPKTQPRASKPAPAPPAKTAPEPAKPETAKTPPKEPKKTSKRSDKGAEAAPAKASASQAPANPDAKQPSNPKLDPKAVRSAPETTVMRATTAPGPKRVEMPIANPDAPGSPSTTTMQAVSADDIAGYKGDGPKARIASSVKAKHGPPKAQAKVKGKAVPRRKGNNANTVMLKAVGSKEVATDLSQIHTKASTGVEMPAVTPEAELVSDTALEDVFLEIYDLFDTGMNMTQGIDFVMDLAMRTIHAESGAILFASPNGRELRFTTARGPRAKAIMKRKRPISIKKGIVGYCTRKGTALAVEDPLNDPRFDQTISLDVDYTPRNILCAPIQHEGNVYGCIELLNKKGRPAFTAIDLNALKYLGEQMGHFVYQSLFKA